jgi:hypothetical protein
MNAPIEIRLTGNQANLAGVRRSVHRHLGQGHLTRVELRYSTCAQVQISVQQARQEIAKVLGEAGADATTPVSVRAHEDRIDEASGEHCLKLFFAAAADRPAASADPSLPWWKRWLARLFPRAAVVVDPAGAASTVVAPRVDPQEAVRRLREAVELATRFIDGAQGAVAASGVRNTMPIDEARVVVRVPELHQALVPLIVDDPKGATRTIGKMIAEKGLVIADGFQVRYEYKQRSDGDGTRLGIEGDLDVVLRPGGPARSATPGDRRAEPTLPARPTNGTLLPQVAANPRAEAQTLLPLPATPAPVLTIRVIGTTKLRFEVPFDLRFDRLPARFDRHALEQAGFGRFHPELLRVASNSCPLVIDRDAGGHAQVRASMRSGPDGADLPMYHDPDALTALPDVAPLSITRAQRVVVNSPAGVPDPAGVLLPALVIELIAGTGWTGSSLRH